MEIALLLALILLNGAFAMSEIALVTARKARLQKRIDEGDRAAAAAVKLGEDSTRFLSTIQVGITSISILNGIVGESALAGPLARWVEAQGMPQPYAGYASTGLVVITITYASIVLGELVPKRLGQNNPEAVARLVARPIAFLSWVATPFVHLLAASTNALLRLLGRTQSTAEKVTEEEIEEVLAEGTSAGVIESNEHTMVRNLFRLDDRQISSFMVPRSDVVFLDAEAPFEENLSRIEACDHMRFPVVRGETDNIIGFVNARRLLTQVARGKRPDMAETLEPPLYVPETVTGLELLDNFRGSGTQTALVIDEYGEVQGLVTLQDLIEGITGEFQPGNPASCWAVQREDGSWLLDGHIPVPELKDRLALARVPEDGRGRYQTLSGMLMLLTGRLPIAGDTVEWEGWCLEIVDMDGTRIDKVIASRSMDEPASSTGVAPPS